jgi:integrase
VSQALAAVSPEVVRQRFLSIAAAARAAEQEALHDEADPWRRADAAAEVWLRSTRFANGTVDQYRRVYLSWRTWCQIINVPPFEALRSDVDAYTAALQRVGNPAVERPRPLSRRSVNRHLSALSSFYTRCVEEQFTDRNPVPIKDRPRVNRESRQPYLAPDEIRALIAAADQDGPRSAALVALLVLVCLRVSEALRARLEEITYENGTHLLWVVRKGDKGEKVPLPDPAYERIMRCAAGRREGLIICNSMGKQLGRKEAWRIIRRLGRDAGIRAAIGPHTLRHAYITRGHELRIPVDRLQRAAGHASVNTTRGYDRSHLDRDTHPSFAIAEDLLGPSDPS